MDFVLSSSFFSQTPIPPVACSKCSCRLKEIHLVVELSEHTIFNQNHSLFDSKTEWELLSTHITLHLNRLGSNTLCQKWLEKSLKGKNAFSYIKVNCVQRRWVASLAFWRRLIDLFLFCLCSLPSFSLSLLESRFQCIKSNTQRYLDTIALSSSIALCTTQTARENFGLF